MDTLIGGGELLENELSLPEPVKYVPVITMVSVSQINSFVYQ